MRFVVIGAGAVGGVVGGRLAQHGYDVALIARGAHLDAIRTNGLRVDDPDGTNVLRVDAAATPGELGITNDDIILLTMKSQDTTTALDELSAVTTPATPVVCVQNGVENERLALRRFEHVYAVAVMCPTVFLEPGVVRAHSSPVTGTLDIGRYPHGVDDLCETVAGAFSRAALPSIPRNDIMRWKYRKLVTNLNNAIEAVCGPVVRGGALSVIVEAEAERVLDVAEIDRVSVEDDFNRRGGDITVRPIAGEKRPGGSSWQSLTRGSRTIETDHLNGEIVLLGRLHGVTTPANATLQRLANDLAASARPPGAYSESDVLAMIQSASERVRP